MSRWNSYISWIQSEVDAAIIAHYEATLKVQKLREKLHGACHDAAKAEREARQEAHNKALKWATDNITNRELASQQQQNEL